MLIVKVRVSSADALKTVAGIVRGDVVSSRTEGKDFVAQLVVHDEAELARLRDSGTDMEILFDARTRPDPREDVSRGDRYAAEVERLKQARRGDDKS